MIEGFYNVLNYNLFLSIMIGKIYYFDLIYIVLKIQISEK